MPPKKQQAKPKVQQKRLSMTEINNLMNAKQKKLYQSLFTLIDKRDFAQIYKNSSELIQAHPDHLDALAFKSHAIYHMPTESVSLITDFDAQESKNAASKPQQTLQQCGLRLLQHTVSLSKTETHLPLQLLANVFKQLQNYSEAAALFGDILKQDHWRNNANFLREKAICAFLAGEKSPENFANLAKFGGKDTRTLALNGGQILKNELSEGYFEDILDVIKKESAGARASGDKWDLEKVYYSQIGYYKRWVMRNCAGQDVDMGSEELLDVEKTNIIQVEMCISKAVQGCEESIKQVRTSGQILVEMNPDNIEFVKIMLTLLVIENAEKSFITENESQLVNFDILDIIPSELTEKAISLVNSFQTSKFQKLQLIVRINRFKFDSNFEALIGMHMKINNANSLQILEKFTDITPIKANIQQQVVKYLQTSPEKSIFALNFILKYTECKVENIMNLFKISKFFTGSFDSKFDFPIIQAGQTKTFNFVENDSLKSFKDEKFENEEIQAYFVANNQQIIQEILILSELLLPEQQIQALKIAIKLDPRDRFLNVKLSAKQAQYGYQTDSVVTYQRFVARNDALLNLFEIQDQNCLLQLALNDGKQSILNIIKCDLVYEDGAKSSEKITNPREPIVPHLFSSEEVEQISDDQLCCLPLQMKALVELIDVFNEQQQDIKELFSIAMGKFEVETYVSLLQNYNNSLFQLENVQKVLSVFQGKLEFIQNMKKEDLQAFVDNYAELFANVQQKLWAHHVELDPKEYERVMDYDPFCFDMFKQYLSKGKIRLNKKLSKFIQKAVQAGLSFKSDILQ